MEILKSLLRYETEKIWQLLDLLEEIICVNCAAMQKTRMHAKKSLCFILFFRSAPLKG